MRIHDKAKVLQAANDNLQRLFPDKYREITLADIDAVYERNVLGISADAKTKKGDKRGYMTGIMYLAPANLSGVNVCPMASQGCKAACLFSAGRGRFYMVTRARMVKTLAYHFDTPKFIETVKKSIRSLIVKAKNKNKVPVVRLNGTSDILGERTTDILQSFPDVQFYDYTKIAKRFLFDMPKNYHLTLSVSENNDADAILALSKGYNVAVVLRGTFPKSVDVNGVLYTVVNGDDTDLRFLDRPSSVVALKAKGKAKKDASGFVREVA